MHDVVLIFLKKSTNDSTKSGVTSDTTAEAGTTPSIFSQSAQRCRWPSAGEPPEFLEGRFGLKNMKREVEERVAGK